MIAVTLDVDWSPDAIVDEVMGVINEVGVPVTLFCTDPGTDHSGQSSSLAGRFDSQHELGLHPNFQYTGDYAGVLDQLMELYPSAKGFRSHQGCAGWPISVEANRRGLVYEASARIYPVPVPPFKPYGSALDYHLLTTRFIDAHMLGVKPFDWSWPSMEATEEALAEDRLFVMCFHPNILYYDMTSVDEYILRKPHYHEVGRRDSFRQKPLRGPMKLLIELFDTVPKSQFTTIFAFGAAHELWGRRDA